VSCNDGIVTVKTRECHGEDYICMPLTPRGGAFPVLYFNVDYEGLNGMEWMIPECVGSHGRCADCAMEYLVGFFFFFFLKQRGPKSLA
jgi:hypothetical protein